MLKKRHLGMGELVGNDQYEGYCVDLAELISKELGFTYEIRIVKDGNFGIKQTDGTWNGMVGELTRRVRHCSPIIYCLNKVKIFIYTSIKYFMSCFYLIS